MSISTTQKKLPVFYALQTNGQVIDKAWAMFLAKHHFLVGLSLDGDKPIHDAMRQDAQNKGSFNKVMRAAERYSSFLKKLFDLWYSDFMSGHYVRDTGLMRLRPIS